MKATPLLIALCLTVGLTISATAQNPDFNLKDYKTSYYQKKSLDLNFNSVGNSSSQYLTSVNLDGRDYSRNNNTTIRLSSLYILETPKLVSNNSANFFTQYDYNRTYYDVIGKQEFSRFSIDVPEFSIFSSNEYYPKKSDGLFYSAAAGIYLNRKNLSESNNFNDTLTTSYSGRNGSQRYSLSAGIGKGRIYSVNDAMESQYIISDLIKQGALKHDVSKEEWIAFSELITKLNNQRYFDNRTYRMNRMAVIDSFLTTNNLIDGQKDISAYNVISDYANFTTIPIRLNGKKLAFIISTNNSNIYQKKDGTLNDIPIAYTNYTNSNFGWNSQLIQQVEIPIDFKWQFGYSHKVALSGSNYTLKNTTDGNDSETKDSYHFFYIIGGYHLGYFPTSRTNITTGISWNIPFGQSKYGSDNGYSKWKNGANQLVFSVNGYYYISPKVRLSGNFNFVNQLDVENFKVSDNQFNFSYNLAITYMLF